MMPVSEQNRLLSGMIRIVQEIDPNKGRPICNEQSCPTMSAGRFVASTSLTSNTEYAQCFVFVG